MNYSLELAQPYIGKRVMVSLRHVGADGSERFEGLWGVIISVHEGGLLLEVEGGIDDEFWMLPPDVDALRPATQDSYQHADYDEPVTEVDYEAYFSIASRPEDLG
jgi:hypothetical protein